MAPADSAFITMIACLVFFTYPYVAVSSSHMKVSSFVDSQKVNVSLYYETLSPNCTDFIVNNLTRVFDNNLISIINLRLVPWGNAYINKSNNNIVCEHGPYECQLNTVAACAIDSWHGVNTHYGLIYCIELLAIEGRYKEWQSCFDSYGLPKKPVLDCSNSANGTKLELAYANETTHLNPPHTFLPWVIVNNQPIRDDYMNFEAHVCKSYKGSVPGC
ncbi:GILT domain-containing protein [Cephalotus follicularis]|uniref:GILT domain-containing protein n=1 Tax=Cephalotus follicularis TaxID=3775 RepID=A0A1Q3C031_CEPFO|nr:GILT domain-containing protein [Cephalotus follicularis]